MTNPDQTNSNQTKNSETYQYCHLGVQLFHMAWPMAIGVLSLMSYQLVDSAFIGQLGVQPLAVVGFTIPVSQMIIGVQVGLGIATTAVISIALGENNTIKARNLAALVVYIGFAFIFVLCLALWFAQAHVLRVLGADASIFPLVRSYWQPWLLSALLGAMLYFGYSIFRANGHTKLPGATMVLTSVLNAGLDPLFIFVFDLGLPGAAWATVCAFGVGCGIVYPTIIQKQWFSIPIKLSEFVSGVRQLLSYMAPAMISQFLPPVSAVVATAVVASYGESVVAAWGLGTRLEFFSIVIVLALTMALPPIIGRLRGQGRHRQIHQLMKIAVCFICVWQMFVALVWVLSFDVLGELLTADASIAVILQDYLWRVPFSHGALGVTMIMVSASNAIGMPMRALCISAVRLVVCYLPALWIGSTLGGVNGLFLGTMIGNFASGGLAWLLYSRGREMMQYQCDK